MNTSFLGVRTSISEHRFAVHAHFAGASGVVAGSGDLDSVFVKLLFGGLEHFLFSIVYGIILPIDFHFFQRGRLNHQADIIYDQISTDFPINNIIMG